MTNVLTLKTLAWLGISEQFDREWNGSIPVFRIAAGRFDRLIYKGEGKATVTCRTEPKGIDISTVEEYLSLYRQATGNDLVLKKEL